MLSLTPTKLLLAQIISHISLLWLIFYGDLKMWLITLFVYFLSGCLGMTMTYHRLLTHRSWKTSKFLEYVFVYFATAGLTGSVISWVSIHKKHHYFSDTNEDPHSTKFKSWFYCHFLSMFIKVELKYAKDLLKEKFYVIQHKFYFLLSFSWGLMVFLIFKDPYALIYAWLAPAAILWNMGSFIVSISHRNGKPFNDKLLILLMWGEGYHKNHHDIPKNSKFGKYDFAGFLIKYLSKK